MTQFLLMGRFLISPLDDSRTPTEFITYTFNRQNADTILYLISYVAMIFSIVCSQGNTNKACIYTNLIIKRIYKNRGGENNRALKGEREGENTCPS